MSTPSTRRRHAILRNAVAALALVAIFVAAGCGALRDDKGRPLNTLHPRGEQAQEIDDLITPVFMIAGVAFLFVEGGVLFLAWKFRRRRDDEDGVDEPVQTHGHVRLELAWTILPALLLAGIGVFSVKTIWKLQKAAADRSLMTVQVVGQQWWWEFRYDTDRDGKPDVITANQMVIPAGQMVRLEIRSNDVIHSFWIPELNGKKDAVPGRTHSWSIQAFKPGLYQGTCTEFCGLSHALMRMEVKALPRAEFDQWLQDQRKPATLPTDPTPDDAEDDSPVLAGFKTFQAQCATCHQLDGMTFDGKATDGAPNADYLHNRPAANRPNLTSGNAPNLTHLMSRNRFAGNLFDLYAKDGSVNTVNISSWIRNPGAMKPAAADEYRGMPTLGLDETQISDVVAFLSTLK
ncbi:MAG: cytochrome c oxidase subunit II [Microthrixaceae bacterium]